MTSYLLDTNILIEAVRAVDNDLLLRSKTAFGATFFTSSISWMEIMNGVYRLTPDGAMPKKAVRYHKRFEKLTEILQIEPLTKEDAEVAAKLYDHSRRLGRMLSFQDALIAGQALSRNFVLVSGDRRAGFELYADMGLKYENWLDPIHQTPASALLNDLL